MPNAFVDTNILVYAAEEKMPQDRKTSIARELMLQPELHLSVQVINEFIANARHPKKLDLPKEREKRWLQGWLQRPVAGITQETVVQALAIHARYGISHWDALIVASALESGCKTIYSEDMNHGQDYAGAKVVNPFL
jgi:predicted nucleic acid-binding protein